jgi:hypothetical protein
MSVETPDQTSEMRLLTDTELDEVNGGFLEELLASLLGIEGGSLGEQGFLQQTINGVVATIGSALMNAARKGN